jgi:hypothetical protein
MSIEKDRPVMAHTFFSVRTEQLQLYLPIFISTAIAGYIPIALSISDRKAEEIYR